MPQISDHGRRTIFRRRFAAQASCESTRGVNTSENVSPFRRFILEAIRCTGVERERQRRRDIEQRRLRTYDPETSENVGPERLVAQSHPLENLWISLTSHEYV